MSAGFQCRHSHVGPPAISSTRILSSLTVTVWSVELFLSESSSILTGTETVYLKMPFFGGLWEIVWYLRPAASVISFVATMFSPMRSWSGTFRPSYPDCSMATLNTSGSLRNATALADTLDTTMSRCSAGSPTPTAMMGKLDGASDASRRASTGEMPLLEHQSERMTTAAIRWPRSSATASRRDSPI